MASKKKTEPIKNEEEIVENVENIEEKPVEEKVEKVEKPEKTTKKITAEPKYKVGSIVYIRKEADADLNGFKLFPQYKKYAYTVEAHDDDTDVYTLRRLNLSLSLKEDAIVSPDERAHDQINRMQF